MSTTDYVAEVKQAEFPASGSIQFAVFNVKEHEQRKAREEFIARFSRHDYERFIRPIIRPGIMAIFENPPTQRTAFYVLAVARRVEKRIAKMKQAR